LCLSVAIRILCTPHQTDELINYAEELLQYFVEQFKTIYGRVNMSYNVHGLVHLGNDVRNFGHLDSFSAFPFETYLGQLKKLIRSSKNPLQQIHRRLSEQNLVNLELFQDKPDFVAKGEHTSGPVPISKHYQQFTQLQLNSFKITTKTPDNCVMLTTGQYFIIENIVTSEGCTQLFGQTLKHIENFFEFPCSSREIGIVVGSLERPRRRLVALTSVKTKCVCFILKNNKFAIFPLL